MIQKFLYLEWKAFIRSASFATNLALKSWCFVAIYFILIFLALGIGVYILKKELTIATVNKFMIYYILIDLIIRLLLQNSGAEHSSHASFPN
jgi:hypothetical protein